MITPILLGKVLGTAAYVLLEYWLGKTDKTKSGSVLELILSPFKSKETPK